MPPKARGVQYFFHGVGQGLFASGALGDYRNGHWMGKEIEDVKFQWVYDCGTASGGTFIDAAINRFVTRQCRANPSLGLVALSHFDRDHISGVVRLLGKFKVDVLLLPYVPLGERLLLALAEGIGIEDPLMLFFVNPVAYLNNADIRGIRRVVFVRGGASGGREKEESAPLPDGPEPREWPDDETRLEFFGQSISEDEPALAGVYDKLGHVFALDQGSPLRIASLWEFIPHNDIGQDGAPDAKFRHEVDVIAEGLLRARDEVARKVALQALKATYDQKFGGGAVPRNRISLFLYAGPLAGHRFDGGRRNHVEMRATHERCGFSQVEMLHREEGHGSILYTGDGYLNSDTRIAALTQCLESERVSAIAVCQVMHHGAKGNWRPGVAAVLAPYFSVFSSDPTAASPGHPHAEVLRDFWLHGPVQVDKQTEAQFHFWWEQRATSP